MVSGRDGPTSHGQSACSPSAVGSASTSRNRLLSAAPRCPEIPPALNGMRSIAVACSGPECLQYTYARSSVKFPYCGPIENRGDTHRQVPLVLSTCTTGRTYDLGGA